MRLVEKSPDHARYPPRRSIVRVSWETPGIDGTRWSNHGPESFRADVEVTSEVQVPASVGPWDCVIGEYRSDRTAVLVGPASEARELDRDGRGVQPVAVPAAERIPGAQATKS